MNVTRRTAGALLLSSLFPAIRTAAATPGVTATEIRIGNTAPYSGTASAYGVIGRFQAAYFADLNERGGIAGRRINFISLDDGYSGPRALEAVRRLIEVDDVAFLFNMLGTAPNAAVQRYVNQRKVPHLFLASGADRWADPKAFPWTIGLQPSYRTEAQIYAKHILGANPAARIAVLHQNDDFGRDYLNGLRDVLGDRFATQVVTASYETADPTIDSQIVSLRATGADALIVAAIPKFAAQAIRRVHDIGWKPLFIMSNVSLSVSSVLVPAGPEKAIGMLSTNYIKDPTDPRWADDPGLRAWRAFMDTRMPGADQGNSSYVYAHMASVVMEHVLRACGDDFSRENIMRQATAIRSLEVPTLLPGIRVSTSPSDYRPIKAMQMMRWDGTTWVPLGAVIEGMAIGS